jgi:cob(I)alamin adenosyltransferase
MSPNGAVTAGDLADLFNDLSQAIDDFRLSDRVPVGTPATELARLKDEAQALEDRAHQFTAQSMAATLAAIQSDLQKIAAATATAKTQLAHLNNVSKAISIATAGVALGAAIATGNIPSIAATAGAFAQSVGA